MTQRVINGEQFDGVYVQGGPDGNGVPITGALRIPEHDYVGFAYSGSTLVEISYKNGGASGETVAALTLSYDESSNLISVAKS